MLSSHARVGESCYCICFMCTVYTVLQQAVDDYQTQTGLCVLLQHPIAIHALQEGPPVRALRASLDNSMLAVQRSAAMLELVNLATGMCFVHSIHKGRGDILSFFWTDAPDTDMVIVTSRAVEINQFAAK